VQSESLGFTSKEHDSMQEFFKNEIKTNDAKGALRIMQKLFKDIRNEKLRKYFIDSLTKHVF